MQLSEQFGFEQLKEIIPYLEALGISDIYASPIFQTKRGSLHGYDVTDNTKIDQKLGGRKGFDSAQKEAKEHGLGWIQDIVPNHMAYTPQNPILRDIMKHGPESEFYEFFDVDWNHPTLQGKILAPFLDRPYRECLQDGEIKLAYNDGYVVAYNDLELPIRTDSLIFEPKEDARTEPSSRVIHRYNSNPDELDRLLSNQFFKLDHWKTALREINYRRFFDIAELICLRQEKSEVFENTHKLALSFLSGGRFSGLRIDHVDGLHETETYLRTLRQKCPDAYIVIEKILTFNEQLRDSWTVEGTTGYDFLNHLTEVFVEEKNEREFSNIYKSFTGQTEAYENLLYECKRIVAQKQFCGDLRNLSRLFLKAVARKDYGKTCTVEGFAEAIEELICSLTIYRTYLSRSKWLENDARQIRVAIRDASRRNKQATVELNALLNLLSESQFSDDILSCFMRLQQFTGAIMAKGFEDTMLYRYTRLLSLNEVGGSPERFGVGPEEFHRFNIDRCQQWPFSLNATSTHDTKRAEDVRARLSVLSEIPNEFRRRMKLWTNFNQDEKKNLGGKIAPDKNEEFYLYQTLLGTFPFKATYIDPAYVDRVKHHMIKAVREGKRNSSWLEHNLQYEDIIASFVDAIFNPGSKTFFADFLDFQKVIEFYGVFNSLSQTLLKTVCPGIPDFYQGTELWDLDMTDPDNRHPVDFDRRKRLLREIAGNPRQPSLDNLLRNYSDGKVKLFVIHKALEVRKQFRELFEHGDYVPAKVEGRFRNNVLAFSRSRTGMSILVVVPRFLSRVVNRDYLPLGELWGDTRLNIPVTLSQQWTDAFTERELEVTQIGNERTLYVSDLFQAFPLALLISR